MNVKEVLVTLCDPTTGVLKGHPPVFQRTHSSYDLGSFLVFLDKMYLSQDVGLSPTQELHGRYSPAAVPSLGCGLHSPGGIAQCGPLCLLRLFLLLGSGVGEVWIPLLGADRSQAEGSKLAVPS